MSTVYSKFFHILLLSFNYSVTDIKTKSHRRTDSFILSALFDQFIDSEEFKDCVEQHIKHCCDLMNDILENLNDILSCAFRNKRFIRITVVNVNVFLTARTFAAAVRPDSVAVAAAEASLEFTGFVLGTAAKIGGIKVFAICAAVTAVRNLCAIGTGAFRICAVGSNNAEADGKAGKDH